MITRRSLIAGLGALFAAPAIIRTPGLLMPVKVVPPRLSIAEIHDLFRQALERSALRMATGGHTTESLALMGGAYGERYSQMMHLAASAEIGPLPAIDLRPFDEHVRIKPPAKWYDGFEAIDA